MRRTSLAVAVLCSLLAAAPSQAGVCNQDVNPAATLLLPYFEVDLDSPDGSGANTIFSINSAVADAALAHVTIWSDLSVPVLDFNVYLTGYDTQVIDLYQLIRNGQLPQTASDGQDPLDLISPQGPFSQDINFANCVGHFPPTTLPAPFLTYLRESLTGKPVALIGGLCSGRDLGDNIARGYITVDTVNNCTVRFHTDAGYFPSTPGGVADVTNQNILWGDYSYVHRSRGRSEGNTLVHIEASSTSPETSTPGQYTFYGRYVGWSALDNREPLPTTFGARYVADDTHMIVWRDSKVVTRSFACPVAARTRPSWFPLGAESIVVFDEQENASVLPTSAVSPSPGGATLRPFRAEAQRTRVGGNAFPVPYASGWAYLNLNTTVTPAGANPPEDPAAAQAWVSTVTANGRFGVGYDAMRYDSACNAQHRTPPFLL